MGYVYNSVLYSAAHFMVGCLLAAIPVLAVYYLFDPTANNWVIASASIAIVGGLSDNHAHRKKSEIEARAKELNLRIEVLEIQLSELERKVNRNGE